MARAYLSIGANLDAEKNIERALIALCAAVELVALSRFYRTEAIGRPEQPDYLNGVACVDSLWTPLELKNNVLRPIEAQLGRVRTEDRYAARCIDLDLLVYEGIMLTSDELTLPDPDIIARPFLSAGLLELAPDLTLPDDTHALAARVDPRALAALKEDTAFTQRLKEQFTP